MSLFRDLESGSSKDLTDGERGLRRANAGGDGTAEDEQLHQVKANDWRNRERVVLDQFSNLKFVRSSFYLWKTSGSRDNLMWANFGKQN